MNLSRGSCLVLAIAGAFQAGLTSAATVSQDNPEAPEAASPDKKAKSRRLLHVLGEPWEDFCGGPGSIGSYGGGGFGSAGAGYGLLNISGSYRSDSQASGSSLSLQAGGYSGSTFTTGISSGTLTTYGYSDQLGTLTLAPGGSGTALDFGTSTLAGTTGITMIGVDVSSSSVWGNLSIVYWTGINSTENVTCVGFSDGINLASVDFANLSIDGIFGLGLSSGIIIAVPEPSSLFLGFFLPCLYCAVGGIADQGCPFRFTQNRMIRIAALVIRRLSSGHVPPSGTACCSGSCNSLRHGGIAAPAF